MKCFDWRLEIFPEGDPSSSPGLLYSATLGKDWEIFPEGDPSSSPGLLYSATLGKDAAICPTPPGLWPWLPANPIG